jgi:Predicted solute binding protein
MYSIRVAPIGTTADSEWTWLHDASGGYPSQSDNQTTTITVSLTNGNSQYGEPNPINLNSPFLIEVQAIVGFYGRDPSISVMAPYVIYGEESEWSSAQTVTLPAASVAPTTTATPTPTLTQPTYAPTTMPTSTQAPIDGFAFEMTIPIIVAIALVVLIVFVFLFRNHRKTSDGTQ